MAVGLKRVLDTSSSEYLEDEFKKLIDALTEQQIKCLSEVAVSGTRSETAMATLLSTVHTADVLVAARGAARLSESIDILVSIVAAMADRMGIKPNGPEQVH